MIRTQVYLTKPLYDSVYGLAKREEKPAAQVIRELLEAGIKTRRTISAKEALMELVRIGKELKNSGPTDLSVNIDKILYEDYDNHNR